MRQPPSRRPPRTLGGRHPLPIGRPPRSPLPGAGKPGWRSGSLPPRISGPRSTRPLASRLVAGARSAVGEEPLYPCCAGRVRVVEGRGSSTEVERWKDSFLTHGSRAQKWLDDGSHAPSARSSWKRASPELWVLTCSRRIRWGRGSRRLGTRQFLPPPRAHTAALSADRPCGLGQRPARSVT
jgi:hypothetical protein